MIAPCPFCGAPAKQSWCQIVCTSCWAQMQDPNADEKAHVAMWNRRTTEYRWRLLDELGADERGLIIATNGKARWIANGLNIIGSGVTWGDQIATHFFRVPEFKS